SPPVDRARRAVPRLRPRRRRLRAGSRRPRVPGARPDVTKPYEVLSRDELDRIPVMEGLEWRPLRRRLGIRAFGTNAYTSERVGGWPDKPFEPSQWEWYFEAYAYEPERAIEILENGIGQLGERP